MTGSVRSAEMSISRTEHIATGASNPKTKPPSKKFHLYPHFRHLPLLEVEVVPTNQIQMIGNVTSVVTSTSHVVKNAIAARRKSPNV